MKPQREARASPCRRDKAAFRRTARRRRNAPDGREGQRGARQPELDPVSAEGVGLRLCVRRRP